MYEVARKKLGFGPEVPDSTVRLESYRRAKEKNPALTPDQFSTLFDQREARHAQAAQAQPPRPGIQSPKEAASGFPTPLQALRDMAQDVKSAGKLALAGPGAGMVPGPMLPMGGITPDDTRRGAAVLAGTALGGVAGRFLPAGGTAISRLLRSSGIGASAGGADAYARTGDPKQAIVGAGVGGTLGALTHGVGEYADIRANRGARMAATPQPADLPPGVVVDPPAADIEQMKWRSPEAEPSAFERGIAEMTPAEKARRELSLAKMGPPIKVKPTKAARIAKPIRERMAEAPDDMARAQAQVQAEAQAKIIGEPQRPIPSRAAAPLKRMLEAQGGSAAPRIRIPSTRGERRFSAGEASRLLAEIPPERPFTPPPNPKPPRVGPEAMARMGGGADFGQPPGEMVTEAAPVSPRFRAREAKQTPDPNKRKRIVKNVALGYWQGFPLVAETPGGRPFRFRDNSKMTDVLEETLGKVQNADEMAMADLDALASKYLTGRGMSLAEQRELLSQAMTAENLAAEARRGRKPVVPPGEMEETVAQLGRKVAESPEVSGAQKALRADYDAMLADMRRRGFNVGGLENYSMLRALGELERRGIVTPRSTPIGSRQPSFMQSRGKRGVGYVESDAFRLYQDYKAAYYKKMAEADLIEKIRTDETVNLLATPGTRAQLRASGIPEGYEVIVLESGMPGGGMVRRKKRAGGKQATRPIKMVIPHELASELRTFYDAPYGETSAGLVRRVGNPIAASATTYNPANLALNIPSDAATAIMGLPGERSVFTGGIAARRLKEAPGALARLWKGSLGQEAPQTIGGRTTDSYDAALRSGSISSTFQHEIGGTPVSRRLRPYYAPPAESRSRLSALREMGRRVGDEARRSRTVAEAYLREAARTEAIKRGLPPESANQIARKITLAYGQGASKFAKSKLSKVVARFAQYPGLMDVRMWKLLTTPGSIARAAGALTLPGLIEAVANTSSPERAEFERALDPMIRDQDHILVKNPESPGGFDVYVTRVNPFNEALIRWGMGNIGGRAYKVATGQEPLSELAPRLQSIPNAYTNVYPLGPMLEAASGKTRYGQKIDLPATQPIEHAENVGRRLGRLFPAYRMTAEVLQQGPRRGLDAITGPFAKTAKASASRMDQLAPSRIYELERDLAELDRMLEKAENDGDAAQAKAIEQRIQRAEAELSRQESFYEKKGGAK